jgi:hypothetical protein
MRSTTRNHHHFQRSTLGSLAERARRIHGLSRALSSYIPGLQTHRNAPAQRRGGEVIPGFRPQPYRELGHSPVAVGQFAAYRELGHGTPGSRAHGYRDVGHVGTGIRGILSGRTTGIPGTSSAANSLHRLVISPGNSVPFNRDQNSSTQDDAFFGSGEGTCRTTA